LRADIAELCEDAERKVANAEDIEDRRMGFCWSRGWFRIARFGELCDPDEERRERKNSRDDEVRQTNSAGFANTICGYLLSRHRGEFVEVAVSLEQPEAAAPALRAALAPAVTA